MTGSGSPKNESSDGAGELERRRFLGLLHTGIDRCKVPAPVKLLIAVSGGADSTALLLGMRDLAAESGGAIKIEAAHFNHRLRGRQSDADERFCRDLCERLNVLFHSFGSDVRSEAAESGESVEAVARERRYRFLAETVYDQNCYGVVTGHTMDDQAETVLLAITRGAGLRGFSGMAHVTERADVPAGESPLRVLRPMLGLKRADAVAFCAAENVTPVEDVSNTDLAYARNRIRHRVLPELTIINPGVIDAISRFAEIASGELRLIDAMADAALRQAEIDQHGGLRKSALRELAPELRAHVLATAYLRATGTARDLDMVTLQSVVDAVGELDAGSLDLPNGVRLLVEYDAVRFLAETGDPACPYPRSVGSHVLRVLKTVQFESGEILSARIAWPAPDPKSLSRWQAVVRPDAVSSSGFEVRSRREGDRFQPLGMGAEMKLQDFLVNRHVPERWRDRVPLVTTERGICWVVGERIAEWARVPEGAGEAVLLEFVPRAG